MSDTQRYRRDRKEIIRFMEQVGNHSAFCDANDTYRKSDNEKNKHTIDDAINAICTQRGKRRGSTIGVFTVAADACMLHVASAD